MTYQVNYEEFYKLLELKPSANWEEIRSSYKKMAQAWHPDRFPEGSDEYSAAEQRFPEIYNAFKTIEQYVRSRGIPPLLDQLQDAATSHFETEDVQQEPTASNTASSAGFNNSAINDPYKNKSAQHNEKRSTQSNPNNSHAFTADTHESSANSHHHSAYKASLEIKTDRKQEIYQSLYTYVSLIFFLLTMGFIYTKWIKKPHYEADTKQDNKSVESQHKYQPSFVDVTKEVTQAVAAKMTQFANKNSTQTPGEAALRGANGSEQLSQITFKESSSSPQLKANRLRGNPSSGLFTYGDTMTTVINAQGPPTKTERSNHFDTWYYGESVIYFQEGKVKEWISHPNTPLASSLD